MKSHQYGTISCTDSERCIHPKSKASADSTENTSDNTITSSKTHWVINRQTSLIYRHGHEFVTYTIEPVKLLPYLLKEFKQHGGKVILGVKVTDLTKLGPNYDLVINCTGVWAGKVAKDAKVAPLRGQVMRVRAPWIYRVILDDRDDGNYIIAKYALNRNAVRKNWNMKGLFIIFLNYQLIKTLIWMSHRIRWIMEGI